MEIENINYLELLKTNQWSKLWYKIISDEFRVSNSDEQQRIVAIKAFLLIVVWGDNDLSMSTVESLSADTSDQETMFFLGMCFLYFGDEEKAIAYTNKIIGAKYSWLRFWLIIEYYGFYKRYDEQFELINKITSASKLPPDWLLTTLIYNGSVERCNINYTKNWHKRLPLFNNISLDKYTTNEQYDSLIIELQFLLGLRKQFKHIPKSTVLKRRYAANKFIHRDLICSADTYEELALNQNLNLSETLRWLTLEISLPRRKKDDLLLAQIESILNAAPDSLAIKGSIATFMLMLYWMQGLIGGAYDIYSKYHEYNYLPKTPYTKPTQVFFNYILALCQAWQNNRDIYLDRTYDKELHVLGESHSLSPANVYINIDNSTYKCKSNLITGLKMHHCANPEKFYHAKCAEEHIEALPQKANILFCIGEIDTRPDEGIWKVAHEKKQKIEDVVEKTVDGYVNFLYKHLRHKNTEFIIIQGVPAPNYPLELDEEDNEKDFLSMICQVNNKLKEKTLQKGWKFLDVYRATVNENGKSNKKWHIDGIHLSPTFYTNIQEWIVK